MEWLAVVGCVVALCVVAVVAIVFGVGFKGNGPGGTSVEVQPPKKR
jgi:ABC-type transporter Mla subunit MlaD